MRLTHCYQVENLGNCLEKYTKRYVDAFVFGNVRYCWEVWANKPEAMKGVDLLFRIMGWNGDEVLFHGFCPALPVCTLTGLGDMAKRILWLSQKNVLSLVSKIAVEGDTVNVQFDSMSL